MSEKGRNGGKGGNIGNGGKARRYEKSGKVRRVGGRVGMQGP